MHNSLLELQNKLYIKFKDEELLLEALTHSSYSNEHKLTKNNERLEYLGDAVLELCMSKYIISNFGRLTEGQMTKKRAQYVCEPALVSYAKKLKLQYYILLGNGEILTGGRSRPAIIADAFEAILGAIFEDVGFDKTYDIFLQIVIPYIGEFEIRDYKSQLQELVQSRKKSVIYKIVHEDGPPHDKIFESAVYIENIYFGRGIGKSKLKAEQEAAKDALSKGAFKHITL